MADTVSSGSDVVILLVLSLIIDLTTGTLERRSPHGRLAAGMFEICSESNRTLFQPMDGDPGRI